MNGWSLVRAASLVLWVSCCPTQIAAQDPPGTSRDSLLVAARQIMDAARYCGLTTIDESGRPQVRTVDPFPPDANMVVWFATNPRSRKVRQIEHNERVALYYFDAQSLSYVTLIGSARLVNDIVEKKKRWKPGWEAFYPLRESGFVLVAVTPERVEVVSTKLGIEGDSATWTVPAVDFAPRKPPE